jgi:hypothetical protein
MNGDAEAANTGERTMLNLTAHGLKRQDRFASDAPRNRALNPRQAISLIGPNLRSILSALAAMYRIPSIHPLSAIGNGSQRRDPLAGY